MPLMRENETIMIRTCATVLHYYCKYIYRNAIMLPYSLAGLQRVDFSPIALALPLNRWHLHFINRINRAIYSCNRFTCNLIQQSINAIVSRVVVNESLSLNMSDMLLILIFIKTSRCIHGVKLICRSDVIFALLFRNFDPISKG